MLLSLVIAIWAAFDNRSALIAFIAATLCVAAVAIRAKTEITVDETELRIGDAHIERRYIGEVVALNSSQMRKLRTRDADPAAFLAFTFWVSTGVKMDVVDPRDPTPYWLISSKRYQELTRTLYR
jgi:hypothetical protein